MEETAQIRKTDLRGFYREIGAWLDPSRKGGGAATIVCPNRIDMMRYRILLHQEAAKSTLFQVEFLTLDSWLRKSLPFLISSTTLQENELAEKLILSQILEEEAGEFEIVKNLKSSEGFFREVIHLWRMKNWYGESLFQESPPGGGHGGEGFDFYREILSLLKKIDAAFEEAGRAPLPKIFQKRELLEGPLKNSGAGCGRAALLFPGHLNLMERMKLEAVENILTPEWSIFMEGGLQECGAVEEAATFFNSIVKANPARRGAGAKMAPPIWIVAPPQGERSERVVRCESDMAEFHFVAAQVDSLRRRGAASHEILILAENDKFTGLQFALRRLGMEAEGPGEFPGGRKSCLEVAAVALAVIENPEGISQGELRDLVLNPMLNLAPFSHSPGGLFGGLFGGPGVSVGGPGGPSSEGGGPGGPVGDSTGPVGDSTGGALDGPVGGLFASSAGGDSVGDPGGPLAGKDGWRELRGAQRGAYPIESLIAPFERIPLEELRRRLRRRPHLERAWLNELIDLNKKLKAADSPGGYAATFASFMEAVTATPTAPHMEPDQKSFDYLANILQKLLALDFSLGSAFGGRVSRKAFVATLRREIAAAMIRAGAPPRDRGVLGDEVFRVSVRPLEEGLRHPLSWLFVCGLTHSAFPKNPEGARFLPGGLGGFHLNLSRSQQSDHFFSSLSFAAKGVSLSFSLENDPAPSNVIFSFLERFPGDLAEGVGSGGPFSALGRDEQLAALPLYDHRNDATFLGPRFLEPRFLEKVGQVGQAGNIARKIEELFEARNGVDYRKYTGAIQGGINEGDEISASALDQFALCPQLFWFRNILGLQGTIGGGPELPLEKREAGSLFHLAAREVVSFFVVEFHNKSYRHIMSRLSPKEYRAALQAAFERALERAQKEFGAPEKALRPLFEARAKEVRRELIDYFERFRRAATSGQHPFADNTPLGAELPFEALEVGGFRFRGRIDRIDYNAEKGVITIIDYKTGKLRVPPKETTIWESAQLPLYAIAAARSQELRKELPKGMQGEGLKIEAALVDVHAGEAQSEVVYWGDAQPWVVDSRLIEEALAGSTGEPFAYFFSLLGLFAEAARQKYYFAVGRKRDHDAAKEWQPPCSFCDAADICDRKPYHAMLARLQKDPLGRRYFEQLLDSEYF